MEGTFHPPLPPGTNPQLYAWRSLTLASPAAGVDWTYTIPSGRVYWIQTVIAQLVTAVAVAARSVRLRITDGSNTLAQFNSGTDQAASLTWAYSFAIGLAGNSQQDGGVSAGMAEYLVLPSQWVISSNTNLLQGADQWSAIVLWFAEYIWDGSNQWQEGHQ